MPDTNAAATLPVVEQTTALPSYKVGDVLVYKRELGKISPVIIKAMDGETITLWCFQEKRFSVLHWPARIVADNTRPMTAEENKAFAAEVGLLQEEAFNFIVALREGGTP